MEAAAGAEDFRGVVFQRIAAGERGNFVAHDVLCAKAREGFPNFNLSNAFLCGVQNKPADHGVSNDLSARASVAGRLGEVLRDAPDRCAEDAAAVQRKTGEQVEDGKRAIEGGKPYRQSTEDFAVVEKFGQQPENATQEKTR